VRANRLNRNSIIAMTLAALLLFAYSNHFRNPFEFDDAHTIVNNTAIRDLRNIPRFFVDASTTSTLPQNSDYRPGLTTLNAIDYALAGKLDPVFFHGSIFASYLILGALLYLLYRKISQNSSDRPWIGLLALLGTGWFLLLTANAETINYIIQRGDSFSTLLVVLSFVIYLYSPAGRKFHFYLIPMVLGCLVKLPAIMFAPLLYVYVLLFEPDPGLTRQVRESRWPRGWKALTNAAPAIFAVVLVLLLNKAMTPAHWTQFGTPRSDYLISQPFVMVHYFDNFLLPLQLSVDTDWTRLSTPIDDRFFAGMAFIVLMLGAAAVAARRRESKPIAFGILWFFIALVPTSSVVPLDEVLNDHRPFFAYIGLVLAFAWGAGLLVMKYEAYLTRARFARVGLYSLVALLLLGNAFGTYQRNRVWSSSESLWRDATIKSPGNARAWMNFGLTQLEKNNLPVALDNFNRALALAPSYSYIHTNLGVTYAAMDRSEDAERYFKSGVQLAPNSAEGYYFYARWLRDQARISDARATVKRGLAVAPRHMPSLELDKELQSDGLYSTLIARSLAQYNAGNFEKSLQAAQGAVEVQPDSPIGYNNICAANNQMKRWDAAIAACQRALALRPDFVLAQNNLQVARQGGR
jgi:protein O-mannosyl-transferase